MRVGGRVGHGGVRKGRPGRCEGAGMSHSELLGCPLA
jgi:hypothetical protein